MNASTNARQDRVVVVDDDARIRDLLRRYLTQEGFDVLLAEDAKALNRLLTRETIDLIVLDLMLPGEDGLSICRRLRAAGDPTPIIMLTAKVEDVDRIVGLEVGDVLRNLVFELLHFAMKLQPSTVFDKQQFNASQRIATLFLELLERQFPIDDNHQHMQLRSASDFAGQLNIHVNHLNKAVKESVQKTTSQLIAERVLQESKILLKHSNWNVGEIAYALGFTEVTHFNNFFKKHVQLSPTKFRNA